MRNHCKLLYLLLALMLFNCQLAFAEGQLKLSHEVTDAAQSGDYHTLSFTLTIDNDTMKDFHSVKLSPSSSEFSMSEQDKIVNVGYLPSMGQAVVQWTVRTPIAIEYFQSGMPVFFVIKAKQDNGNDIELPAYSRGGNYL